jgi:hypothetical protein
LCICAASIEVFAAQAAGTLSFQQLFHVMNGSAYKESPVVIAFLQIVPLVIERLDMV